MKRSRQNVCVPTIKCTLLNAVKNKLFFTVPFTRRGQCLSFAERQETQQLIFCFYSLLYSDKILGYKPFGQRQHHSKATYQKSISLGSLNRKESLLWHQLSTRWSEGLVYIKTDALNCDQYSDSKQNTTCMPCVCGIFWSIICFYLRRGFAFTLLWSSTASFSCTHFQLDVNLIYLSFCGCKKRTYWNVKNYYVIE